MAETEAAAAGEAGMQKLFGLDGPEALEHIVGRFTPDSAEFQMMDLNESTNVLQALFYLLAAALAGGRSYVLASIVGGWLGAKLFQKVIGNKAYDAACSWICAEGPKAK